jgi:hypothetical protein
MKKRKTVLAEFTFCPEDPRGGSIEVFSIEVDGMKAINLRLIVGGRSVPLPKNRTEEVIAAIRSASEDASVRYQQLIEELNHD